MEQRRVTFDMERNSTHEYEVTGAEVQFKQENTHHKVRRPRMHKYESKSSCLEGVSKVVQRACSYAALLLQQAKQNVQVVSDKVISSLNPGDQTDIDLNQINEQHKKLIIGKHTAGLLRSPRCHEELHRLK